MRMCQNLLKQQSILTHPHYLYPNNNLGVDQIRVCILDICSQISNYMLCRCRNTHIFPHYCIFLSRHILYIFYQYIPCMLVQTNQALLCNMDKYNCYKDMGITFSCLSLSVVGNTTNAVNARATTIAATIIKTFAFILIEF